MQINRLSQLKPVLQLVLTGQSAHLEAWSQQTLSTAALSQHVGISEWGITKKINFRAPQIPNIIEVANLRDYHTPSNYTNALDFATELGAWVLLN